MLKMKFRNLANKVAIFRNFCEKKIMPDKDEGFKKFLDGELLHKDKLFIGKVKLGIDLRRLVSNVLDKEPLSDLDLQVRQKFKGFDINECSEDSIAELLLSVIGENLNNLINLK